MAEKSFLDFDLLKEGGEGDYQARVLNPPAGQATNKYDKPFSELEIENFVLCFERPRQAVRLIDLPEIEAVRIFGARLFQSVFDDEVYVCYRSSLN